MTTAQIHDVIRDGTPAGMPGFNIPEPELQSLTGYLRGLNPATSDAKPEGDAAAGERFFFGGGKCSTCHTAMGQGRSVGPDLSSIGKQVPAAELRAKLENPSAQVAANYATMSIKLRDGRTVRGFARKETLHTLQFQSSDGRLLLLNEDEYQIVSRDKDSIMPALKATPEEERDLVVYLSSLGGVQPGPLTVQGETVDAAAIEQVMKPKAGEWPSYNGLMTGNRHSPLTQITTQNAGRLALQWLFPVPYNGLEATPLVADGVMYVSGPNMAFAIDARSGVEIWRYTRPRQTTPSIPNDAALGANRGLAMLGDRIFAVTDDAHLLCLDRLTGALRWDVYMPEEPQHYGGTSAPLVVGDLVISGTAGADEGIRGFVAAFKATTGQLAWRFWTIPAKEGEPGYDTWKGTALRFGGGSTWLTGSYDPELKVLYWPTGNPYPDTDGSERMGDNLYTNSIVALDPATGKMLWYRQFTPHDLHDWDATEPPVLADVLYQGRPRKLLLHADRNGFFYVLDRTNGDLLLTKQFVQKLTWATGIDEKGRPIENPGNVPTLEGTRTCPDIRGAANWMATAFNPATGLYYVMTIENCGQYRSNQFGTGAGNAALEAEGRGPSARGGGGGRGAGRGAGGGGGRGGGGFGGGGGRGGRGGAAAVDPPKRYLRAIDINTGKVAWEIEQKISAANYGGAMSTAGGLVFYTESSGAFSAVDAKTGKNLWHFETGAPPKSSPMTYLVNGRQYVAVAAGANVLSFALPGR
jgi:PQQ-dependent dehydrogenase (methanol/ethanol family)